MVGLIIGIYIFIGVITAIYGSYCNAMKDRGCKPTKLENVFLVSDERDRSLVFVLICIFWFFWVSVILLVVILAPFFEWLGEVKDEFLHKLATRRNNKNK